MGIAAPEARSCYLHFINCKAKHKTLKRSYAAALSILNISANTSCLPAYNPSPIFLENNVNVMTEGVFLARLIA